MLAFANKLRIRGFLNRTGDAGPRRFILMGGAALAAVGAIAYVSSSGSMPPLTSTSGRLPDVDPLPGGLRSTPHQEKLALLTNQEEAAAAAAKGLSYTPPMGGSEAVGTLPTRPDPEPPQAVAQRVIQTRPPTITAQPIQYTPDLSQRPVAQVSQAEVQQEQQSYNDQVNRLLRGWNGRTPRTDVQPISGPVDVSDSPRALGSDRTVGRNTAQDPLPSSINSRASAGSGRVLMPSGRGLYGHTVLAASSDYEGPVVVQADSGPLAGDRMIGTFSKAASNGGSADRLVVRLNTLEHRGASIGIDAILIAPETMETTVASSVDQHLLARFALPAAAAFVQGLGQAIATTSNTNTVLSPFGGASYSTQLNLPRQLAVGAGVAAGQLGNTLSQQAPRGPTIHLDANANVGVLFLAPVLDSH